MCMHLLQCNCARAACRQHTHTCACICCSVTVCAQQMGMHATHTHTHSSAGGPVPPQIIHVRAQQMGMQAIHTANNNALTRQMGMHAIAVLTALISTLMCTHVVKCNCAGDGQACTCMCGHSLQCNCARATDEHAGNTHNHQDRHHNEGAKPPVTIAVLTALTATHMHVRACGAMQLRGRWVCMQ